MLTVWVGLLKSQKKYFIIADHSDGLGLFTYFREECDDVCTVYFAINQINYKGYNKKNTTIGLLLYFATSYSCFYFSVSVWCSLVWVYQHATS